MAGINRLGKAPPRPGSLRPPDPNRNKTLDVFSEGTEGDADYMRMVQDKGRKARDCQDCMQIEDTQGGQSGWLFGRGAFDKGDLLYLRDEEEKKRFKEEELRDSERLQFLRMQATTGTPEVPLSQPPKPPNPDNPPPKPKSALLANIVRIKGSKAGAAPQKRGPREDTSSTQQKRSRTESGQAQAHTQPAPLLNGTAGQQKQLEMRQEQAQAAKHQDTSDAEPALAGLLGDYDSEEGDDDADGSLAGAGAQQPEKAVAPLPSQTPRDKEAAVLQIMNTGAPSQQAAASTEVEVDYD